MKKKSIPAARHQQIVKWLDEKGFVSISELENRLCVSHMTIHRDLETLARQGLLHKVRGGAVHIEDREPLRHSHARCAMCGMRVRHRLEFIISPKNGPQSTACCPHCGIMLLTDTSSVESTLAKEYLYGRMVNVYQAHYVVASSVHLCCEPTVLCFAERSDAEMFSQGFGGLVMDFSQTTNYLASSHRMRAISVGSGTKS